MMSLGPVLASAYSLQTLLATIFIPLANEKFFDLGGSLGFLTTAATSLAYPLSRLKHPYAPRQLILSTLLGLWAFRLGLFLSVRAIKAGGDSRFDKVKHQPGRFAFFWFAQATWITLTGLPVYLVNTLPRSFLHPRLGALDVLGIGLFAAGWGVEVIADRQKTLWKQQNDRKEGEQKDKFISSGLWGVSRHPNYAGEITLWTGIYLTSLRSLYSYSKISAAAAAVSPLFTWFLLTRVSGVPPLERAGNKKFGDDPKWKEYTSRVPVLWPFVGTAKFKSK